MNNWVKVKGEDDTTYAQKGPEFSWGIKSRDFTHRTPLQEGQNLFLGTEQDTAIVYIELGRKSSIDWRLPPEESIN